MATLREMTTGLQFPRSPIALADGSVLVVEMKSGLLTQVFPNGKRAVMAELGGGPSGAALGPDGCVYICNSGGFSWQVDQDGLWTPGYQTTHYTGGSIQRVDLTRGQVETLYTECHGRPLRAPSSLVFDRYGGFWFTDAGVLRPRERDRTGIYYATPDGSCITEAFFPLDSPSGIGLSPDGAHLYVAETFGGRVWEWNIDGPGEIQGAAGEDVPFRAGPPGARLIACARTYQLFGGLALDSAGNVCLGTSVLGGITIVEPNGWAIEFIRTPDPCTTGLCFGGVNMRTIYVTLSATGRLAAFEWLRPGLKLHYANSEQGH